MEKVGIHDQRPEVSVKLGEFTGKVVTIRMSKRVAWLFVCTFSRRSYPEHFTVSYI